MKPVPAMLVALFGIFGMRVHAVPVKQAPNPERLADAIYIAEGGKKAKTPFGICSQPVKGYAHARRVCLASIRKNVARWEAAGKPGDFVSFMGRRWAPVGASNDPRGLNRQWPDNVRRILNRMEVVSL